MQGKTFLSSMIINELQSTSNPPPVAFAFLNHQTFHENYTLTLLHSFLFQLVIDNKVLRPVLSHAYADSFRKLTSSTEFVEGLLKDILKNSPMTYFIVDGLDEVAETDRRFLLKSLMSLKESPNLKLLISSRAEYDITLYLKTQGQRIQVHESNSLDISAYVYRRIENWLSDHDPAHDFTSELRRLATEIAQKSEGDTVQESHRHPMLMILKECFCMQGSFAIVLAI